jgi:hypothetical protein
MEIDRAEAWEPSGVIMRAKLVNCRRTAEHKIRVCHTVQVQVNAKQRTGREGVLIFTFLIAALTVTCFARRALR